MRIVTRPDFDGIVCAVVIQAAMGPELPILWIEPNDIQSGTAPIEAGDIIANLPYDSRCTTWFDHHVSNRPKNDFDGRFEVAPSAAGVAYHYYKQKNLLNRDFDELIFHTDKIDSADLTEEEVLYPERHPYILLSMTIQNHGTSDKAYWNKLVEFLRTSDIDTVMTDPEVQKRCGRVIEQNKTFASALESHTRIDGHISITDFRELATVPSGNRFLTYSMFPQTAVSMKIRYKSLEKKYVLLSIGKSIFNSQCRVNIGKLLSRFGGGGHDGAGGCTLEAAGAPEAIDRILEILRANAPEKEPV